MDNYGQAFGPEDLQWPVITDADEYWSFRQKYFAEHPDVEELLLNHLANLQEKYNLDPASADELSTRAHALALGAFKCLGVDLTPSSIVSEIIADLDGDLKS